AGGDRGTVRAGDVVEFAERVAGAEGLNRYGGFPGSEFDGQAFREAVHPGFGGAVADVLRGAGEGGDGGDIDDAGPGLGSRREVLQSRVCKAGGGDHVQAVHGVLAFRVGFEEVAVGAEAGVVDEQGEVWRSGYAVREGVERRLLRE